MRESEGKREKAGIVGKFLYLSFLFLLFWKHLFIHSYFLTETLHVTWTLIVPGSSPVLEAGEVSQSKSIFLSQMLPQVPYEK